MTVKIDKYSLQEHKGNYYIFDRTFGNNCLARFESKNKYLNKKLGEVILKELNTGNYEELEK